MTAHIRGHRRAGALTETTSSEAPFTIWKSFSTKPEGTLPASFSEEDGLTLRRSLAAVLMADIPLFFFVERVFCLWASITPPLGRALKKAPGAEWKETAGQALTSSLRMSTTNGSDKLTSLPVGRWLMVRRLNVTYELVVSTLVKGVCILCILLE